MSSSNYATKALHEEREQLLLGTIVTLIDNSIGIWPQIGYNQVSIQLSDLTPKQESAKAGSKLFFLQISSYTVFPPIKVALHKIHIPKENRQNITFSFGVFIFWGASFIESRK